MKIPQIILDVFRGRPDAYGECYRDNKIGRWAYGKRDGDWAAEALLAHMTDTENKGIGIYPLMNKDGCWWVALDLDFHDTKPKPGETKDQAAERQAEAEAELSDAEDRIREAAKQLGISVYIEASKGAIGRHAWIFFAEEMKAYVARQLMFGLLVTAGITEDFLSVAELDRIFPVQDSITENKNTGKKGYGNLIHLPFSAGHPGGYFIDESGEVYGDNAGAPDCDMLADAKWFCEHVERHTMADIKPIFEAWSVKLTPPKPANGTMDGKKLKVEGPAGMQRMLDEDQFFKWARKNPDRIGHREGMAMLSNLMPFGEDGIQTWRNLITNHYRGFLETSDMDRMIFGSKGYAPFGYAWIEKETRFRRADLDEADQNIKHSFPAKLGTKRGAEIVEGEDYRTVWEYGGKIWKKQGKAVFPLSNFVLEPKHIIRLPGRTEWLVDIVTPMGRREDVSIGSDIMTNNDKFRTMMREVTRDASWYGQVIDLIRYGDVLNEDYEDTEEIMGTDVTGLQRYDGGWAVVTRERAWRVGGERVPIKFQGNESVLQSGTTFQERSTFSKADAAEIQKLMMHFNDHRICASIWGWMAAAMVKERLRFAGDVKFPFFSINGEAGAGKSETMNNLMAMFFALDGSATTANSFTEFTMLKGLGASNLFLYRIDEYKPSAMAPQDKWRIKKLSEAIRHLYNRLTVERGRPDGSFTRWFIESPLVVCGEESFQETAIRERAIPAFFSKEESVKKLENFKKLIKLPLGQMGNAFLNWTLTLEDDDLVAMHQKVMDEGDPTTRVDQNIGMVIFGMRLLARFFKVYKVRTTAWGPLENDVEEYLRNQLAPRGGVLSAVEYMVREFAVMRGLKKLDATQFTVYTHGDKPEVRICLKEVLPLFMKYAREHDYINSGKGMIGEDDFRAQVKKMDGYVKTAKNLAMGGAKRYATVLDLDALLKRGILDDDQATALRDTNLPEPEEGGMDEEPPPADSPF